VSRSTSAWIVVGRRVALAAALATATASLPGAARAQVRPPPPAGAADTTRRTPADTGRRPAAPADTTRRARGPRRRAAGAAPRPDLKPPVTPRRALISSLLLPGLGQSRLERPTAGAIFVAVELAAVAMIGKSLADLRAARALRADTITTVIPIDSLGRPATGGARAGGPFDEELVRARSLHVEDWIATILFNHLISGAEAFVSAQLYDLPAQVGAFPTPRGGAAVAVSVAW
jgi:hypothetical protein